MAIATKATHARAVENFPFAFLDSVTKVWGNGLIIIMLKVISQSFMTSMRLP
jgi:hypothetical protein